MKLERLELRHVTSLEHVVLDLVDLPTGLVALTGENGAGKTTVLESALAALYRTLPSRGGDLKDYATDRDALIESRFSIEGLGVFRARVQVDGIRGTSDAILEHQGRVVNDGKVSTFDAAVRQRFPSLTMMLASAVALQNKRGNFIGKKPKERKDLFTELLGLQAYEPLSATAKSLVALLDQQIDRLTGTLDELAVATSPTRRAVLDATADQLRGERAAVEDERARLVPRLAELEGDLAVHHDAITANAEAWARVTALRDEWDRRVGEQAEVEAELGVVAQRGQTTRDRLHATCRDAHLNVQRRCDDALKDYDTRLASNRQLQENAAAIRAAVASLTEVEAHERELQTQIDAVTAERQAAAETRRQREQQLAGLARVEEQATRARAGAALIDTVPFGEKCAEAQCQFLTEAIAAKSRIAIYEQELEPMGRLTDTVGKLSAAIDTHRERLGQLVAERFGLQATRQTHQHYAQYADKLTVAETRIAELTTARAATEAEAGVQLTTLTTDLAQALAAQVEQEAEATATLQTRLETLGHIVLQLRVKLETAVAVASATEDAHAIAQRVQQDLADARQRWDATTATLASVTGEEQAQRDARERFMRARQRHALLAAQRTQVETDRQEWQALQQAFSRDGVAVLEMDAAGPRISQLVNELLTVCFGPRFSVELVTQQAKATGGMKESFELLVTDNVKGGIREIGDLSGGEQVIVSEALMNAMALYVNLRSPMPIRTCWRDETTGALDVENGVRYIEMLRRVQALGSYHHILFVSQSPALAAMADAQIHVAHGGAEIRLPPYGDEVAA